jgi:hypothetical protein
MGKLPECWAPATSCHEDAQFYREMFMKKVYLFLPVCFNSSMREEPTNPGKSCFAASGVAFQNQ